MKHGIIMMNLNCFFNNDIPRYPTLHDHAMNMTTLMTIVLNVTGSDRELLCVFAIEGRSLKQN